MTANVDPVSAFLQEVWNRRKLELLEQITSPDYCVKSISDESVPVRDRLGLRRHIEEWIEAFPDLEMNETDRVATPRRVASVIRVTGTHSGAPFQGFEATGRTIDINIVAIFDTDGGRLLSHSTLVDVERLLQQLAPASSGAYE